MATTEQSNVIFGAKCHCGNYNKTHSLSASAFPLKSSICQCNSCRRSTGQFLPTYAVVSAPPEDQAAYAGLTKYSSSKTLDRYFCPTCGASMFNVDRNFDDPSKAEWEFATGVLEFDGMIEEGKGNLDGKLKRALLWLEDCQDGGACIWLDESRMRSLIGRHYRSRYTPQLSSAEVAAYKAEAIKLAKTSDKQLSSGETLSGRCHCGQIQLQIQQPDVHADLKDFSAELCACTTCRKTSGFEITAWAHIPRDKVRTADGSPYTAELLGKLSKYESSPGVARYFCGQCGTKVFYDQTDLPRIDIALGIFDPSKGSRVESWFSWNPDDEDVAFLAEAVDKEFADCCADGVGSTSRLDGRPRVTM